MTTLLDRAVEAVRRMPPATQDAIAQLMLNLTDESPPSSIEGVHLAAVMEGLAEAERGEFATDEEVAAAFRRFEQ